MKYLILNKRFDSRNCYFCHFQCCSHWYILLFNIFSWNKIKIRCSINNKVPGFLSWKSRWNPGYILNFSWILPWKIVGVTLGDATFFDHYLLLNRLKIWAPVYRLKNNINGIRAIFRISFMPKTTSPFSSITHMFNPLPFGLGRMSSLWLLLRGKLIIRSIPFHQIPVNSA